MMLRALPVLILATALSAPQAGTKAPPVCRDVPMARPCPPAPAMAVHPVFG